MVHGMVRGLRIRHGAGHRKKGQSGGAGECTTIGELAPAWGGALGGAQRCPTCRETPRLAWQGGGGYHGNSLGAEVGRYRVWS